MALFMSDQVQVQKKTCAINQQQCFASCCVFLKYLLTIRLFMELSPNVLQTTHIVIFNTSLHQSSNPLPGVLQAPTLSSFGETSTPSFPSVFFPIAMVAPRTAIVTI